MLAGMEAGTLAATPPEAASPHPDGASSAAVVEEPKPPVTQAFGLGWNISRLFVSGTPPARRKRDTPPKRLPSPGSLSEGERSLIRLVQVRAIIEHLEARLAGTSASGSLHEAANEQISELLPADDGAPHCKEPRANLLNAHIALGQALSCCDARLSKAYHLGVSLASTCYAPTDPESLVKEFDSHRTAQIGEWLADLTSLFPAHSCRAVRLSCRQWRRWVEEHQGSIGAVNGQKGGAGPLQKVKARATNQKPEADPRKEWTEVRRTLARQGEVWRALLSGEKPGTAMLELRDYVAAAGRALGNGAGLIRRLWPVLVAVLALVATGTVLALAIEGPGARLVGLASFAGAIGITWKGIGGSVGTVAARFQEPVWGAALDEEIASAITTLPGGAKPASGKAWDTAPASGPPPSDLALHREVEQNEAWAP
jgi:hypothetical protein